MPTFIKSGLWETRTRPGQGYKGELNLDQLIDSKIPPSGPVIDGNGNVIIDDTSNDTVVIPDGMNPADFSQNIPNFSGMFIVNDHYDGRVETWIAGGGDGVLISYTNIGAGPCTSTVSMDSNGYTWANNDGMLGPFTFTVIKTRNGA